jgi:hypothetical protein
LFVIDNEGDLRELALVFTVFKKDGTLVYDSRANFERALIEIGHYPDKRSHAKGS